MTVDTARLRLSHAFLALASVLGLMAWAPGANAQGVTTSRVTATVADQQGQPLVGARVAAVHEPSGTQYVGTTREDGRVTLLGMRVGGPYRVTVSYVGYQSQSQTGINLTLGVGADLRFEMVQMAVQVEGITTVAQVDPVFSSQHTGAATTVAAEALAQLPTITRRVEDFLRLNPQYSGTSFGFSFAGQDNRLNNMTVDGSYFNNSFGLAGQPGDRTSTSSRPGIAPISIDAIEQVQVNVSPYDVRQGNFVGAGVNIVTRGGTNEFRGSLYYQTFGNSYVGTSAGGTDFDIGTFNYHQIGATFGGPIIRNRLFFFASFENDGQTSPGTTFRALGSTPADTAVGGSTTRVRASALDSLSTFLRTNFGYDPGAYQGYDFETPSTRALVRVDYNANERNRFTLRYHMLNSSSDILVSNSSSLGLGNRRGSTSSLNFANSNYAILENLRSIVGEWNSQLRSDLQNNMIIGYNSSDESRKNNTPPWFPLVEILEGGSNFTTFGFEPFTPANQLRYWNFQFQNNLTYHMRNHAFTFGLSVERYHSNNVFFPGAQSVYVYRSLQDFYDDANDYLANPNRTTMLPGDTLRRFQVRWSNIPGQVEPAQPLDVLYAGVYAQDEWRPSQNLTVVAGLRVDRPSFGNTGYTNFVADAMAFRDVLYYPSGKLPDAHLQFSPRVGFNLDVGGRQVTQVRGGTGLFSGRPAYVWISNQVGNSGVLTGFAQIDNTTTRPFHPDPDHYKPVAVTGQPASSFQLALTDPEFRFPQVWRSNLGIDRRLPWGLTGTAELLYSRDVNGIAYINANLPYAQTRFTGPDNRPRWVCPGACPPGSTANRIYSQVSDATVLTNQARGSAYNLAFSLERQFQRGLFAKLGYSYGVSKNTVDPGSIASGSFTGNQIAGDPNVPELGYSQFSPRHRLFAALSYQRDFFGIGATTVSLFWEGRTSGNGSYSFSGDLNGDAASNDLIYIQRDTSEMNFEQFCINATGSVLATCATAGVTDTFTVSEQRTAWEAYIQQDEYLRSHRGQYAERNAVFLPMLYRMDFSIAQDIAMRFGGRSNRFQVRVDFLNFLNLIDENMGQGWRFQSTTPLIARGADAAGAVRYRLRNFNETLLAPNSFDRTTGINDVWRMQLTVRYTFN